jgi:hypothetical protein
MDQEHKDYADDDRPPGRVSWLRSMAYPLPADMGISALVLFAIAFTLLARIP